MSAQKIIRTYKYRLYPTITQKEMMLEWLETCRRLFNTLLEERITNHEEQKLLPKAFRYYIGRFDQYRRITKLKKENEYLRRLPATILQDVADRIDRAVNKYIKERAGYPKFKKQNNYFSFTYKQQILKPKRATPYYYFKIKDKRINFTKIGSVKAKISRPIPKEAKIKNCTISKYLDQWHVHITTEREVQKKDQPINIENTVGIDVGLLRYATLCDGTIIENPKCFREMQRKIAHERRNLSRKVKGSNNYEKQVVRILKLERKVREKRRDFIHKISTEIIKKYSVICIEDLSIENMRKNRYLSKSISDVGWRTFFDFLEYKAEEKGKIVVKVDYRGTSQECSNCGSKVPKSLRARWHKCNSCGIRIDRDVNSAITIRKRGVAILQSSIDNTAGLAGSACRAFKESNETRSSE